MLQSQRVSSSLCSSLRKKFFFEHTKDPNSGAELFNLCWGELHKDRREFLQVFQCSGERQILGAVGHPWQRKSSHKRGNVPAWHSDPGRAQVPGAAQGHPGSRLWNGVFSVQPNWVNHSPITFLWFGGKPLPLNRDKKERAEVPHWIWNSVPDLDWCPMPTSGF